MVDRDLLENARTRFIVARGRGNRHEFGVHGCETAGARASPATVQTR